MNLSIRTLLITLLLGLPLILGAYTYLYSVYSSEQHITSTTRNDILRLLTHNAETIHYLLNADDSSQIQHVISRIGEDHHVRQALLFDKSKIITSSIHIANLDQSLENTLRYGLDTETESTKQKIDAYINSNSNRAITWHSINSDSIYGLISIHHNNQQGALRPDGSYYLFIQQDLSPDLAASSALAINIIIFQFILSILIIVIINQFVLSRLNILRKVATSLLGSDNSSPGDEIDLFDRTITQLSNELTSASKELKKQNQLTLNVFNSTNEGIFGLDKKGIITFANKACIDLLGYDNESQLLGKEVHQLLMAKDLKGDIRVEQNNPILRSLHAATKAHMDMDVFQKANKGHLEVEYWTSPLVSKQQDSGMVVTFLDISERRKAQEDLIMKEAAITNSLHGIAMADMDGNLFYVNNAMANMWGYESCSEMLGRSALSFWKNPQDAAAIIKRLLENERVSTEMEAVSKDGTSFIVLLSASISVDQNGTPLCLMASFVDISKQKEVEAALLRSEETYAKAEEIAHIGSWDWNIVSGDLRWTDEIFRIFGQRPRAFGATYEAFLETIHPDDRDNVIAAVNASVSDANTPYSIEHRVVRPSSEIRIVHERGKVYRDEDGAPIRMIGTVHDVTETKEFEKALREERNFVNAILDSAGALVIVMDTHGHVVRFNRACQEVTGYSLEEIIDQPVWEFLLLPEMEQVAKGMFNNLEQMPNEYINHWLTKQGGKRLISWSNRIIKNEANQIEFVVSIGIDITEKDAVEKELEKHRIHLEQLVEERTTELQRTQSELVRKERLATLGQLTATVSHELRNPLGAMRPSIFLIKKLASQEEPKLVQAIDRIERNISRCDHIIDELLDFTRITEIEEKPIALDLWLKGVIDEQTLPDSILRSEEYGLDGIIVSMDEARMRRCIINLFDNACQAMMDENFQPASPRKLTISTEQMDERLYIHIDDNGPGIDPQTLKQIFEPLFSTKGFGVGLGLPTVRQIMQQHQGDIEVDSSLGNGTRMSLWLPDTRILTEQ